MTIPPHQSTAPSLTRPQSSHMICRRSWNGRGRLLRHLGEGDDGEDRGHLPSARILHAHRSLISNQETKETTGDE